MCSCWDRWGSRPLFEDPAEEAGAGRAPLHCNQPPPPLGKIFRTQSQRATSSPSTFLQTTLCSDTAALLLSRHTLHAQACAHTHRHTHTKKNVYRFTAVQRQWKTAWGLSRCADKNSVDVIYERERKKVRGKRWRGGRGKKGKTSDSVFKSILDSNHLDIVMSPALWLTNHHKLNSSPQLSCRRHRCESIVEILGCQSARPLILCIGTENAPHHYSYH